MTLLKENHSIYVAGSGGMVGSALCRLFLKNGYCLNNNLLTSERNKLNLTDTKKVKNWFKQNKPDIVIVASAKVGGIMANQTKPVDFLLENLKIQNNLIEASYEYNVKRLLFLGSSCIYPKFAKQPIKEKYLLGGNLEKSNQWYAIAKIAGLKLCEAYRKQYNFDAISVMPSNLYGPGDNFHFQDSHVIAALIRKFYEAKIKNQKNVTCWGTGNPKREFLYVDDLADACFQILKQWTPTKNNAPLDDNGLPLNWLNIGSKFEISIKELAYKISKIIDYEGDIIWDKSKPDGTPRKKLDNYFINKLGWKEKTNLDIGLKQSIKYFEKEYYS
tara:strand:+ start:700 stop:1689 length:990 start_codon:yes stop_codon:yes gene_type:complete